MDDGNLYLIVKSLHIISVIAWSAALLYLPRLFVYHSDLQAGSEVIDPDEYIIWLETNDSE